MSTDGIRLIAAREYRKNLRSKGVIITTALMLLFIVAGVIASHVLVGRDDADEDAGPVRVAVAGAPALAAEGIETTPAADEAAAREMLEAGRVDAALWPGEAGGEYRYLAGEDAPGELGEQLQGALIGARQAALLRDVGVDPAAMAGAADVRLVDAGEPGEADGGGKGLGADEGPGRFLRVVVTVFAISLLFIFLLTFAGTLAQGVVEEKGSRVVEILLAAVRPLEILTGKLLGSALSGLTFALLVIVAGGIALNLAVLPGELDIPYGALIAVLPAFLLGYLFFAALYAAAGSLVSRMEDFSAAGTPVIMLAVLTMYAMAFGFTSPDSTFMAVAGWVPPLSITVAPVRYAAGELSGWEYAGSMVLLALASVVVLALAARVYPRTVLRTGKRVGWLRALRG